MKGCGKMRKIQRKTDRMLEIEKQFGEPIEELLRRLFVDENKNLYDMASELGVAYRNILKWLKLAGIYSRKLL
jgi:hypothetical protein